jgi:O-antigen/teichoic acid export membrane protein
MEDFPQGFWSFAFNVHILTFITFAYSNLDQVYVLNAIGIGGLATYFLIIQLVEVIRFIPIKLGQVLLASFSGIVHSGDRDLFRLTYQKAARYIGLVYLMLSAALLCSGKFILSIYGIDDTDSYFSMVVLIVGFNIACIGNMNSMVLLSQGLSRQFLINNVLVVATMILGFYCFAQLGIFGVFLAKTTAIVVGQIGLFTLIVRSQGGNFVNWKEYFLSQALISFLALFQVIFVIESIWMSTFVFVSFVGLVFVIYRVSPNEIVSLLKNR